METSNILQAVCALIFVAALIGLSGVIGRKFIMERNILKGGQKKRMQINEVLYLDSRRKLVLVKKDEQELLIMLSPNGETLINTSFSPVESPALLENNNSFASIRRKLKKRIS